MKLPRSAKNRVIGLNQEKLRREGEAQGVGQDTPNCNNVVIEKKQKVKSQIGIN